MKVVDMHCDTIGAIYNRNRKGKMTHLKENDLNIDVEKMKKGDYLAQCFAMFVPFNVENPFETCMDMIDCFYQELEKNKDQLALAKNAADIERNEREGKMSAILTIEEGGVTKGNLSYLRDFYRLGVRMITLTWNFENGVGFPNFKMSENPDFKSPNGGSSLPPTVLLTETILGSTDTAEKIRSPANASKRIVFKKRFNNLELLKTCLFLLYFSERVKRTTRGGKRERFHLVDIKERH